MTTDAADAPMFCPPGMLTNDNWFAKLGDTYHAFYLQVPACVGANNWAARGALNTIGHATSKDLIRWTDHGPVIAPMPDTYYSRLATGSVAAHDGKWWMVFTAGGKNGGVGLAVSDDLNTWKVREEGAVVRGQVFEGTWKGKKVRWHPCADPFLYPEPVDGWYYMLLNSQDVDAPISVSGCVTTLRSRDLVTWESAGILAYPGWCERPETPCLWRHGDRWYLYFGAAHDHGIPAEWQAVAPPELKNANRINCVFTSASFDGPFEATGKWCVPLPHGRGAYIYKIFPGPDGSDVLIATAGASVSPAYPVTYAEDGSLILSLPAAK